MDLPRPIAANTPEVLFIIPERAGKSKVGREVSALRRRQSLL